MKKIWKYALLLAGVLAATATVNQALRQPSCGILYRVDGGKSELYLLGSIHVGTREMYPFGEHIQDALQKADVLVFECDTTGQDAASATAKLMKSDVPLRQTISEEGYAQVERAALELGYSMESLQGLKPWAVTSTFTLAQAAREMDTGRRNASAYGVENMVRKQADGKNELYLETAEAQLEIMDAFSPALQEYLLQKACQAVLESETGAGTEADVEYWPSWWKEGSAKAFADSYAQSLLAETQPELTQEYHHALMTERNQSMAQKLHEMLQSPESRTYLATIGLMHLVLPEDSILTQLEQMGYRIERVMP